MPIDCSDCDGTGEYWVLARPIEGDCREMKMKCSRCRGEGQVPREMKDWMAKGKRMRDRRLAEPYQSQRDAAREVGISVVEWSMMESGKIEPKDEYL